MYSKTVLRSVTIMKQGTCTSENDVLVVSDDLNEHRDVLRRRFLKTQKRMMRYPGFSVEFKNGISNVNGMSNLTDKLRNVTMTDLENPERAGWLYDQSEHKNVWCILADMLFCVFENESSEKPSIVVILPGCSVRSLVYRSVKSKDVSTKTVSGIDKYQIIIDDCSSRKKYLFSLDNQFAQEEWMTLLKAASKLDNDGEPENGTLQEPRRHSIPGISSRPQGSCISPTYAPSPKSTTGTRSSYAWNETNDGTNNLDDQESLNRSQNVRNSIGDIRRKLRRDNESESLKSVPMKAMHFEGRESADKKSMTFKKIRSFGSLESLFKPKRKHSKSDENGETHSLDDTGKNHLTANGQSPLAKSHDKRLSQSLDFGKSEKGLSKGIVRTASDLKDRLMKSASEKSGSSKIKLKDLNDISISGFLQYKYLIKWQKLWCEVSKGCLYGFKTQNQDETPDLVVFLNRCEVAYVSDQDKRYKRMYVFKLTQKNKKSIYLNACDYADLSRWLQILQMESSKIQCDVELRELDINGVSSSSVKNSTHGNNGVVRALSKTGINKRHSLPNGFMSGSDDTFSSSADDSECSVGIDNYHKFIPPQHDETLKQVWEKDKNHLFNVVRAKLSSYKHRNDVTNKDLTGSHGDGLHIVTDGKTLVQLNKEATGATGREVRRSHSFHIKARTDMADMYCPDSPASTRKRHKPLTVKKITPSSLGSCPICGGLERRLVNGEWIRYWYALKDGTLFSFLTEDDTVTVDIQDLHGYKVSSLIDQFRGKRFAIKLAHEEVSSTYLSADSRDEMELWVEKLQSATGQPPSEHSQAESNNDNQNDNYQEKCQSVKQKLLQEMLRQKRELELKQAARQKKHHQNSTDTSGGYVQDDQLISDVVRLRQRRMSTQIKMDTIQKQMQPQSTGRKFLFGKKKKVDESKTEHLQEQLRELSEKMQTIDIDISRKEMLDMNQNKKPQYLMHSDDSLPFNDGMSSESLDSEKKDDDSIRGNSLKLKNSVQKFAQKTKRSLKGKSKKQHFEVPKYNGLVTANGGSNGALNIDLSRDDDDDDSDQSDQSPRKSNNSLIDLTKSRNSTSSDDVFENSKSDTSLSPRKEIDPTVLAEIDAFEELTRQVLNARAAPT
ncbi:Hypothetical predicted protein [Mytilus galloprovincialis]|uniref:PH domain-containing protein n=1 Tax=Mytilus galloprovincialis TaxID=29158 RepID=A0A8B6G9V4_MYTGA|nr:Hypothetical predicted protein [Mytilus galloprovincialis]